MSIVGVLSHGLIGGGGTCDYPAESDVRSGVDYGDGAYTGTYGVAVPVGGYDTAGEAICARLLFAVDGTTADGRVYPTSPTQDVPDYVVYRRVSGGGSVNFHGRSGVQSFLFRIDVYAGNEEAGETILAAINDTTFGLPGWSDRANGVHGCFPSEDADTDILDDATRVPGQSFTIWFEG